MLSLQAVLNAEIGRRAVTYQVSQAIKGAWETFTLHIRQRSFDRGMFA